MGTCCFGPKVKVCILWTTNKIKKLKNLINEIQTIKFKPQQSNLGHSIITPQMRILCLNIKTIIVAFWGILNVNMSQNAWNDVFDSYWHQYVMFIYIYICIDDQYWRLWIYVKNVTNGMFRCSISMEGSSLW